MTENKLACKNRSKKNTKRLAACICALFVLVFSLVMLLIIPFKTAATDVEVACYISVEVRSGDSLWSLAEEYGPEQISVGDYIQQVRKINHIWTDQIMVGDHIVFPIYSTPQKP